MWTKNPAAEKTATLQYYMGDPEVRRRAWQNRVTSEYWTAEPNAAHHALVDLERKGALHFLVTQNIDGLHHAAGQSPDIVVEIHGNVREAKCMACGWRGPMADTLDRVRAGDPIPRASTAAGSSSRRRSASARTSWPRTSSGRSWPRPTPTVFLALGTSLGVYPAAALPEIALRAGARLVIVNAEETPFDPVADAVLRDQLGDVLPALAARSERALRWEYPTLEVGFTTVWRPTETS